MKLLARIGAPLAWKVVRQHDGYTYFENSITDQRSCRWDGSAWGHVDYNFMRSGDISYEPFGRRTLLAVAAFQWRKLAERAAERQERSWPWVPETIRPN
jgi:hypothetical protein